MFLTVKGEVFVFTVAACLFSLRDCGEIWAAFFSKFWMRLRSGLCDGHY